MVAIVTNVAGVVVLARTGVVVLARTGAAVVELDGDVVVGGTVTTAGSAAPLQAATVNAASTGRHVRRRMPEAYSVPET